MHHGVARDAMIEILFLALGRQFTVEQEVADFEEIAVLGELVDGISAVQQNACVTIDVSDLRFAACRRSEAGIVSEGAGG